MAAGAEKMKWRPLYPQRGHRGRFHGVCSSAQEAPGSTVKVLSGLSVTFMV